MATTSPFFGNQGLAPQFQNLYYQPSAPATTTYGTNPSFSLNPSARSGQGAFGAVPGAIGAPDPFSNLSAVFPNLSGTNKAASAAILAKLGGQLSPGTINSIKDAAAAWGVGAGVPGSSIQTNRGLRDLGLTSEGQVESGMRDYASLIPTIASTQTVSPELLTQISATNAVNASAPDPTQAASYAQQLFNEYLNKLRGGGGGAGGTGAYGNFPGARANAQLAMNVGQSGAPFAWTNQFKQNEGGF